MSRFDDRFVNHPIHNSLETVLTLLDQISEQPSQDAIVELERIKQVCLTMKDILSSSDPNLVYMGYLDSIHNNASLTNAYSSIAQFRNDRSITHLHNANNYLDNCLPPMVSIMVPNFPHDIEGIRKSVVSFRSSVTQHLRYTEEEFKKIEAVKQQLEQGMSEVGSTVELQKSRLDNAIATFQQQFSQTEENRRQQFSTFEAEIKKIHEQNEDERKNEFEQNEKSRLDAYKKRTSTWSTENEQSMSNFRETGTELQDIFKAQAEKFLDKIDEYKNQAAKTLNIISNTGMAGGYNIQANREARSRAVWRGVTMLSMVLLVVVSIWSFLHPLGNGLILGEIARRVFVAATFATVAGYSARQAKIHLDAERRYRQMELELTSLNPYLAELDDPKRYELIEKMAALFFGKSENETNQTNQMSSSPEINVNLVELAKLLENAQALIRQK